VIVALGESACGLHESARVISYLADQSAGQCGPCVHGLAGIDQLFSALAEGTAREHDRVTLERWIMEVRGRGACHHPDGVARFAQSAYEVFGAEIARHRLRGCSATPSLPVGASGRSR
jgi:NADH:ubiquinone oxidoreductase subunit F (NADH-binding)